MSRPGRGWAACLPRRAAGPTSPRRAWLGSLDATVPLAGGRPGGRTASARSGRAVLTPVLLAKASASLAAVSGGRLTLGLAPGGRADDFESSDRPLHTRGRDFDAELELLHRAWAGEPVKGAPEPVCPPVPGGRIPLLFGGNAEAAIQAIRDALRAFEDVGVTQLYMDPAAASLDQVDRLADAIT